MKKSKTMVIDRDNKEQTTVQRLLLFLDHKRINRNQFYLMSKTATGALGPHKKDISAKTIEKTLNVFPDLNLYWLIGGKGEMVNTSNNDSVKIDAGSELFNALKKIDKLRDELDLAKEDAKAWEQECRIKDSQIFEQKRRITELEQINDKLTNRNVG